MVVMSWILVNSEVADQSNPGPEHSLTVRASCSQSGMVGPGVLFLSFSHSPRSFQVCTPVVFEEGSAFGDSLPPDESVRSHGLPSFPRDVALFLGWIKACPYSVSLPPRLRFPISS